jgi:hypothetical protein
MQANRRELLLGAAAATVAAPLLPAVAALPEVQVPTVVVKSSAMVIPAIEVDYNSFQYAIVWSERRCCWKKSTVSGSNYNVY